MNNAIELFDLYLSSGNYSESTRTLYRWALSILSNHLNNPQVEDIKPNDMQEFWAWLRHDYQPKRKNKKTDPLAGRSLENIWTAERSFFKWCREDHKIKKTI